MNPGDLSRGELHALVDALCDARERAESANDREQAIADILEIGDRLILGAVGYHKSRRMGAALDARDVFDVSISDLDAVTLAQREFGPDMLRDKERVAAVRRMISRALLDCPWLPRWLVNQVTVELLWANFGGEMRWLARPTRPPGMKSNHAALTYIDAVLLVRIHYHAGYNGKTRDAAAVELLLDQKGVSWDRLQRIGRDLKAQALCEQNYRQGKADRAANRRYNPPMAAHYDAAELEAARRDQGGTKRNRRKIV